MSTQQYKRRAEMKEWKQVLLFICLVIISGSLMIISMNFSYGNLRLRSFNKLNGTNYTIQQWRVYEYDIRKIHPFSGQR